jgi:hypothetical protein
MAHEPRHLSELLRQGSLADLAQEAERRRMETASVRRLLPAEEAAHLVNAATNDAGELVLTMDSPAWAARVRYCVSGLPNKMVRIGVLPRGG